MLAVLEIGPWQLALAAALILVHVLVSLALQLGLERRLLTAFVRALVQLSLLGLVLEWVFSIDGPWAVIGICIFMSAFAGFEAVRRTTHRVQGMYPASIFVMMSSSMLITLYGVSAVIHVDPWYTPQYVIPILGMMLGNTLNGISLGLETALSGFVKEREKVELLLAHGATRKEATHDVVRDAVRTGLVPILNAMIAAGVIAIPGMMTGQILGGEPPQTAARYQLFILFSITGGVALGTVGIVYAVVWLVFDDRDRLRTDRITSARS